MAKKDIISLTLLILTFFLLFNYLAKEDLKIIENNLIMNNSLTGYKNISCEVLTIQKINLKECLYNINDSKNSLDYGLLVIQEEPLIIAGHSGSGPLALFNNLDKLELNDQINVDNHLYNIDNIYLKEKKNALIIHNDLILVTCYQDKQLVIEASRKENNV